MRQISANFFRTVILSVIALWVFYLLRFVLLPFFIAAGVACLGEPVIDWAQRRFSCPRWMSAITIFIIFLLLLSGAAYAGVVFGLPGLREVLEQLPSEIQALLTSLFGGGQVHVFGVTTSAAGFAADIEHGLRNFFSPGAALNWAAIGAAVGMGAILTIVLVIYFLLTGPRLVRGAIWTVPPRHRPMATLLSQRMFHVIWRYIGGMAIIVAYAAILTWCVSAYILHIQHAVLMALVVGCLELVPIIGPTLSALIIGAIALSRGSVGVVIGFAGFAFGLRMSIDQLIGPVVLGTAVELPAAVIIFAMLVGGAIWGILGVFVAVPFAAFIRIALQVIYEHPAPGLEN